MITTTAKEWIRVFDGASPLWVKELNETTYSVVIVGSINESFYVLENTIDVSDYTREEIKNALCPAYYDSLEQFEDYYPDKVVQNQYIAECIAQNDVLEGGDFVLSPLEDVVKEMEDYYGIVWSDWAHWA